MADFHGSVTGGRGYQPFSQFAGPRNHRTYIRDFPQQFPEKRDRVHGGCQRRYAVDSNRPVPEGSEIEAQSTELIHFLLERQRLRRRKFDRDGKHQCLGLHMILLRLVQVFLEQDPLMSCMRIDEDQSFSVLGNDVACVVLAENPGIRIGIGGPPGLLLRYCDPNGLPLDRFYRGCLPAVREVTAPQEIRQAVSTDARQRTQG